MSFGQTIHAALNADIYGHVLEHQAERVLLYPLYLAALCTIAAAAAVGLLLRLRRQSWRL